MMRSVPRSHLAQICASLPEGISSSLVSHSALPSTRDRSRSPAVGSPVSKTAIASSPTAVTSSDGPSNWRFQAIVGS